MEKKREEGANYIEQECLVCGRKWRRTRVAVGRDGLPKRCPRCHSPNWAKGAKWRWEPYKKERWRARRRGELIPIPPLEL